MPRLKTYKKLTRGQLVTLHAMVARQLFRTEVALGANAFRHAPREIQWQARARYDRLKELAAALNPFRHGEPRTPRVELVITPDVHAADYFEVHTPLDEFIKREAHRACYSRPEPRRPKRWKVTLCKGAHGMDAPNPPATDFGTYAAASAWTVAQGPAYDWVYNIEPSV